MVTAADLTTLARELVGTSYDTLDCWQLAAHLYSRRDIELRPNWMANLIGPDRLFDTAFVGDLDAMRADGFVPQPWDLVVMRTHPYLPSHVAVVIDREWRVLHSLEDSGVVVSTLTSPAWAQARRIVAVARLRVR